MNKDLGMALRKELETKKEIENRGKNQESITSSLISLYQINYIIKKHPPGD